MTTADNKIEGMTQIINNGPASLRFCIVILGDGYQSGEMDKYHTDVENFVKLFLTAAPFDQIGGAINIYRVDVASAESGADDPKPCADGTTGTGATPLTYFDATFCGDGSARRLLKVNNETALDVAETQLPEVDLTMVIVNTSEYGGSGGSVATFSAAPDAAEIGLHEIGHSAFGLADEYDYYLGCGIDTDRNQYPGGEPDEPNVTMNINQFGDKWQSLTLTGISLPTTVNPDCTQCDQQESPVSPGTVGAFEGARYYHCGCYRSEFSCRMRELGSPFCAACQNAIRQQLAKYTLSVSLATPSIAFTNTRAGVDGAGRTTTRSIAFDVSTCTETAYGPVTFRITAGPTGGFRTSRGKSVTLSPSQIMSGGKARLRLSYTPTAADSPSDGSVSVHCDETGEDWVIPIVANGLAGPVPAGVADFAEPSGEQPSQQTPKTRGRRKGRGKLS